jgi:hypothetical protein
MNHRILVVIVELQETLLIISSRLWRGCVPEDDVTER